MYAELSPKAAEIVTLTRSLLEAGGYNSFSYADISARVQISKASIHYHFPTKAELVREVVARYRAEAREGLAMLDRQLADPAAALQAYVAIGPTASRRERPRSASAPCWRPSCPAYRPRWPLRCRGILKIWMPGWHPSLSVVWPRASFSWRQRADRGPVFFMSAVYGAMLAARGLADPRMFEALVAMAIKRLTRDA